jgi:DNA-binding beta-propeller fold protein YncE
MGRRSSIAFLVATLAGCNEARPPPAVALALALPVALQPTEQDSATPTTVSTLPTGPAQLVAEPLPLPGADGPASLDYIVCERARSRVWVPVGSTGSVDVLDVASRTFTRIDGFATVERETRGKKRRIGPSAATVGDGLVYIGNRATNEICPIDVQTLQSAKCLKLGTGTDGVAYVRAVKEVWVTTPKDQTLTVLDSRKPLALAVKATVKLDGAPEGYAVDEANGLFFTNLEDKGSTLVIDVRTHKVKATWNPGCGADGPRGIAFDPIHNFAIVACTDHVQVLDSGHDGALLGKLDAGGGIDNVDYVDGRLYVAAGKVSRLTVASLDDKGLLTAVAIGESSEGHAMPSPMRAATHTSQTPSARAFSFSNAHRLIHNYAKTFLRT